MFYIYKDLFSDEKSKNKIDDICDAIKNNKFILGVYCIILSTNANNLFDIININELRFNFYHNTEIYIVGVSKGKKEAVNVVAEIAGKAAVEDNIHNIRSYFDKQSFNEL